MENIVLTIHLLLALALTASVLLQRSEGGMGSLGGGGGGTSARAPANPLTKVTWVLAAGFLATSIALTIIAATKASQDSVIERLGADGVEILTPNVPATADDLTAPLGSDAPLVPPSE
ncbi:MAG TPA: preprotein translocase subunit SecG [Paracoccaceae bacterium]|nr:preprotein translocase subunit SecG [Paracoccaceae bacterium]